MSLIILLAAIYVVLSISAVKMNSCVHCTTRSVWFLTRIFWRP